MKYCTWISIGLLHSEICNSVIIVWSLRQISRWTNQVLDKDNQVSLESSVTQLHMKNGESRPVEYKVLDSASLAYSILLKSAALA